MITPVISRENGIILERLITVTKWSPRVVINAFHTIPLIFFLPSLNLKKIKALCSVYCSIFMSGLRLLASMQQNQFFFARFVQFASFCLLKKSSKSFTNHSSWLSSHLEAQLSINWLWGSDAHISTYSLLQTKNSRCLLRSRHVCVQSDGDELA